MAHLELHTTDELKRVDLDRPKVTIGRHEGNKLSIDDHLISRYHCEIERTSKGYVLRDLNSRNGTVMGGLRVEAVVLKPGSQFTVGNTTVRFVDEDQAAAETARGVDAGSDTGDGFTFEEDPGPAMASANFGIGSIEALATIGRDVPFDVADVSLINARGQVVHAAEDAEDANRQATAESIRLIRLLLMGCIRSGASDLHLEPKRSDGLVRLRIDGAMVQVTALDDETSRRMLSAVKVLCDIDITKKAIVQEGHFSVRVPERRIDYRVSVTPSMFGQKLVIRVLDPANAPQVLKELDLPDFMHTSIRTTSRQNTGLLIVCGPTGSGKTTTLYAVLRQIDAQTRNVITIEDPVEYEISGVTQIPVDEDQGQSFNSLLRSVLRQDPDVMVLGEIRDRESATTVMQAATTGHLVLTTIHAKDTIGTIFRLLDLGVEPYLVASTLNLVLGQRLARLLCPHCKDARKPTPPQVMRLGKSVEGVKTIYAANGCPKCFNTGYAGRKGFFELLTASDDLRDVILNAPNIAAIKKAIEMTLFISLRDAGTDLILKGLTSMDEIDRVVGMD